MINEQQVGDSNMALPKYESRVTTLVTLFGHIICSIIKTYPASFNSLKCMTLYNLKSRKTLSGWDKQDTIKGYAI
jgi:hypothetical protein